MSRLPSPGFYPNLPPSQRLTQWFVDQKMTWGLKPENAIQFKVALRYIRPANRRLTC